MEAILLILGIIIFGALVIKAVDDHVEYHSKKSGRKSEQKEWKKILVDYISKLKLSDLDDCDVKGNKYFIYLVKEFEDCKIKIDLDALLRGYCDSELIYKEKLMNSEQSVEYLYCIDIFEGTDLIEAVLNLRKSLFRKGLCLSHDGDKRYFTKMNEEEMKYILDLYKRFSENKFLISEYELKKIKSSKIEEWYEFIEDIL